MRSAYRKHGTLFQIINVQCYFLQFPKQQLFPVQHINNKRLRLIIMPFYANCFTFPGFPPRKDLIQQSNKYTLLHCDTKKKKTRN